MYIALYDENKNHITNIDNVTHDITTRVYDPDAFNDEGNYKYACYADTISPDQNKRTVKGLDFKTLWDTQVLLDYTGEGSFDGRLSAIFNKIKSLVFNSPDAAVTKIPVVVNIPVDNTDTTAVYGSYQGTYQMVNAYKFLKGYLKYYEYNIETGYNVAEGKIIFSFVKCTQELSINLSDFIHELTTTSTATNNGNPVYVPKYKPRPATIATKYYYRTQDNDIVQDDASGDISGRLYPVRAKWFEAEYLAAAQFDAVYELANARFVDNIVIDNNIAFDPINFADYPLYTKVKLYYDGKLYKTLPISEKITTLDGGGENTKIKLGFKKILLTEIIKN